MVPDMITKPTFLAGIIAITAWTSCLAENLPIVNNPFNRPALPIETPREERSTSQTSVRPTVPRITAILMSGEQSLVNLDGEIMHIGDEHNGYRLQAVGETTATFTRHGSQLTLSVDDDYLAEINHEK